MRTPLTILLLLLLFAACRPSKNPNVAGGSNYPNNIGDIKPDSLLDDATFRACRESNIPQYYSITSGYKGEKPAIERYFKENFKKEKAWAKENGYLTIRFVVNCNGQTGRFRIQEMDPDYQPKKFPETLSAHLLQLTKQLDGWLPGKNENIPYDYYQYLTFAITNGEITRIMP